MGYTPDQHYYLPVPGEQGFGPAVNQNFLDIDTAITSLQASTNPNAYVPTGGRIVWSSRTIPTGWLVCDGSAVSRSEYADLFAVIGTAYGVGNGSTTFNVPDMRGRFIVGADLSDNQAKYALRATGGAETITLDLSQIPSHDHGGTTGNAGAHGHSLTIDSAGTHSHTITLKLSMGAESGSYAYTPQSGGGISQGVACSDSGSHTHTSSLGSVAAHTHTIASNGSGAAHENLPPYVAEIWLIKT